MNRDNFPRRRPDAAFRPVGDDGGLVVLSERSEVKVLNPVGCYVFGLLDGEHSRDQIIAGIMAEFDIDAEQARADLDGFLDELEEHGMMLGASAEAAQETHG